MHRIMAAFTYAPLRPNSCEIRFIDLQSGPWDAEIQCSIHHGFLDRLTSYEALSYTWGDPHTIRSIHLNGCQFDVTANLEVALRYLRQESKARILWIDAICINQRNLKERSEQIKRMRDIYTFATKVIAWTGEADGSSDEAIMLMKKIGQILDTGKSNDSMPKLEVTLKCFQDLGLEPTKENWAALWNFCNRPYWSRMWVIQELFYSGPMFETISNRCII